MLSNGTLDASLKTNHYYDRDGRQVAREQDLRSYLGSFNFPGDMALGSIENFSGGEKARLALALIVWQRPNLLPGAPGLDRQLAAVALGLFPGRAAVGAWSGRLVPLGSVEIQHRHALADQGLQRALQMAGPVAGELHVAARHERRMGRK